jgi:CheY-like chemotaxis protein
VCDSRATPLETILFVEDDALVRMDMAEFLRECGYVVHEAATAEEAIEALQAILIDLVFTDINLSEGMNGLELAEWTLHHRPGVKVLVTTGNSSSMEGNPETVESLLAKPYNGRDLVEWVKNALTKGSGGRGAGPHTG